MSAKSSSLPEKMDVTRQIGPEPAPIPNDHEPAKTSAGNLGERIKQLEAAARQRSDSKRYDEEDARRKQQREHQKRCDLWRAAMVPPLHERKIQYTVAQLDQIKRMVASFGTGAIWAILGDWGTGKTQESVEVIRSAVYRLMSARFTTAIEFFVYLRSPYSEHDNARDEGAVILDFVKPALLVIDDAHVRADTDFENRLLHYVIDKRHIQLKETILTSNQSADVFEDTIGGAIIDRMCAAGGIIECNWPSFRGKAIDDD